MSKTKIGIIICLILLFVLGGLLGYSYVSDIYKEGGNIKQDFLSDVDYFKDKMIKVTNNTIEIDGRIVTKKSGYYLMNVSSGDEELYCNFVGAVQKKLGVSYDDAVNVCLKTISGEVDYGVIHAERKNDNVVLSVNYNEKTNIIPDNVADFGDIIKLDDNVYLKSGDVVINNISYGITDSLNLFNICGYVKGNPGILNVSLYDKDKKIISTQEYDVSKDGNFCVNFFDLSASVYYYSFG